MSTYNNKVLLIHREIHNNKDNKWNWEDTDAHAMVLRGMGTGRKLLKLAVRKMNVRKSGRVCIYIYIERERERERLYIATIYAFIR